MIVVTAATHSTIARSSRKVCEAITCTSCPRIVTCAAECTRGQRGDAKQLPKCCPLPWREGKLSRRDHFVSVTRGKTLVQNSSIVFIRRSCGISPLYIHANIHRIGRRLSRCSTWRVTVSTVPTKARPLLHRSAGSPVFGSSRPFENPNGSNHSWPQK